MSDARIEAYSRALFEVAQAEGNLNIVEDELFRMARAIEANEKLRSTLTDASIPAARRQQVVEELLGGKASNTTIQLVSLIIGAGRGRDLPAIVNRLVQRASSEQQREVAELEAKAVADLAAARGRSGEELRGEIARLSSAAISSAVAASLNDRAQQDLIEGFINSVGASK